MGTAGGAPGGGEGGAGVAGRPAARAALGRPAGLAPGHLPGPRASLRRRARAPALARAAPRPRRGLANQPPSLLLAGGIDFGQENTRDARGASRQATAGAGVQAAARDRERGQRPGETVRGRTFPQAPAPLLLGEDQATKQAILAAAPAHRFLHLATHGFFAGESEPSILLAEQRAALERGDLRLLAGVAGRHPGLLSGLVFAGVNRSDRRPEETILTALEAAELELGQVELVVLSACNTGRGQVAGGEGVLGLQRAFQLAGARSVVASLWRVPDEETHQLMREFYRRVWSEQAGAKSRGVASGAALDAGELEAAWRPGTSGTARTAATVRLGRFCALGRLAVESRHSPTEFPGDRALLRDSLWYTWKLDFTSEESRHLAIGGTGPTVTTDHHAGPLDRGKREGGLPDG